MSYSAITDTFLRIAEERLEDKLRSILHQEGTLVLVHTPVSVAVRMMKEYFAMVQILNSAGNNLAQQGFAFEPIDSETSFKVTYDRLLEKYT